MSYNFNPMSDEEINNIGLFEEGVYDFEVLKSTEKVSKSNNTMAELQINIWNKNGKSKLVFDYLVFSKIGLNIKKVKNFCDTTGLQEQYKKGELPGDLSNLNGKTLIGIQEPQPKPTGGFYPSKNYVMDYVTEDKKPSLKVEEIGETEFKDDDIPF